MIDAAMGTIATARLEAALIVSVRMVKRAMTQDAVAGSWAQSVTESAGPFSTTLNYGSTGSTGELWLSKADRALLGISSQKALAVEIFGEPRRAWWW